MNFIKYLTVFLLLLVGFTASAQTTYLGTAKQTTEVRGTMIVDTAFRPALDTVSSAPLYSIAIKTGVLYVKGADGFWHPIQGGGGADSAIWKNNGTYIGNHTLTMGSHTQTVVGNVWNFDSLNLLVRHYLYADSILWFGDSYFVGVGASNPVIDMASLSCLKLQAKQANHAVSGTFGQTDITVQFANIPGFDSLHRYIIMNWGVNDMRGAAGGTPGIDTTHFKDSVGRFIDTCIARGWPQNRLIYLSIVNAASAAGTNSIYHSNYFSAQKNLCLDKGIVFIDMMTPFQQVSGRTDIFGITSDGIHPNDQGHELYSTIIASTLGYHTVAQGQGLAVNKTIEANNITLRGLPYASYKAVPLGVDTNGHLVNFNQAAFIPNNNDSAFGGNINLSGQINTTGNLAGGTFIAGGTVNGTPKYCTKCLVGEFNSATNSGMLDALNFSAGGLPLCLNCLFGYGTVTIGPNIFDASDYFEVNGKSYFNGLLQINSTALANGSTVTDSAIVETTTANVAVFKKVSAMSLLPTLTNTQRDAISSPAEGSEIYSLTDHAIEYWNGAAWKQVTTN